MDRARHERVGAIFREACDLEGDAQDAFVAEACGDDEDLRAEVLGLLAVLEREQANDRRQQLFPGAVPPASS